MKMKDGFVLRTVAGETVVLPTGGVTNFDMMITLNDTGKVLWQQLERAADELRFAGVSTQQLIAHLQKGADHEAKGVGCHERRCGQQRCRLASLPRGLRLPGSDDASASLLLPHRRGDTKRGGRASDRATARYSV